MPVEDVFTAPLDALTGFVHQPGPALGVLSHLRMLSSVVTRVLAGMAAEEGPDIWRTLGGACESPSRFLEQGLAQLVACCEEDREELRGLGIELPRPPPTGSPAQRLLDYAGAVHACLESPEGCLVLVVDPAEGSDPKALADLAASLVAAQVPIGVKLLVLDCRDQPSASPSPLLERLQALPGERVNLLSFDVGPEQIEAQVLLDLADPKLTGLERAASLGMAAAFCSARRDFEQALALQTEALALHAAGGSDLELKAAYELGTTQLAAGQAARDAGHQEQAERLLSEAEGSLARSLELGLGLGSESQPHPLVPLCLTHLAITQYRQGKQEPAARTFEVAARSFRAREDVAGEAFARDAQASELAHGQEREGAGEAWRQAEQLFASLKEAHWTELRETGLADVQGKLSKLEACTEQPLAGRT